LPTRSHDDEDDDDDDDDDEDVDDDDLDDDELEEDDEFRANVADATEDGASNGGACASRVLLNRSDLLLE
jgi:hypothetical protein